jgi:hypothetical protein
MTTKELIARGFEAVSASLRSIADYVPDIAADTKVSREAAERVESKLDEAIAATKETNALFRNLLEAEKRFHADQSARLTRVETTLRSQ